MLRTKTQMLEKQRKKKKINKLMLLSNYVICDNKNWIFMKNKELHNFND